MRPEILALLASGIVATLSSTVVAQERAAFDCRAPGTAVEAAICASPRLIQLQNRVAEEFRLMTDRVGLAEARQVSSVEAALLSSCEADRACIEDILIGAVAAFRATASEAAVDDPLQLEPEWDFEPAPDFEADPELGVTSSGSLRDWPVGADGVLILPSVPEAPSGWLGDLSPEDRLLLGAPQMVPGSGTLLRPLPPLEAAFRDLSEERRRDLQARMALVGFRVVPDGLWGPVTEGTLLALALEAEARGQRFDGSTREGAAALVAYIESAEFAEDFLAGR